MMSKTVESEDETKFDQQFDYAADSDIFRKVQNDVSPSATSFTDTVGACTNFYEHCLYLYIVVDSLDVLNAHQANTLILLFDIPYNIGYCSAMYECRLAEVCCLGQQTKSIES